MRIARIRAGLGLLLTMVTVLALAVASGAPVHWGG